MKATTSTAPEYTITDISTLRKHLRRSKASDCRSVTIISIDGRRHEIADLGNGPELYAI
jgi:hypothetical protein